jgi:hypothetical protein
MSDKMKPILVIPKGSISADDIKKLNDNGICTVESDNPAMVKFLDPIPSAQERGRVEQAAIQLSRLVLNGMIGPRNYPLNRSEIHSIFVECLLTGTPLDRNATTQDQERRFFEDAKRDELNRLAREEAREERRAAKEAKKAEAAKTEAAKAKK